MNSPSREHLLGYVLGALEPGEQEQVEAELEHDPVLRAELARVEVRIQQMGLAAAPDPFDPPLGLAARTCRFVAEQSPAAAPAAPVVALASAYDVPVARRWRAADLVAAAAVVLVGASLLFPFLSYSRFQGQVAACQNNLRQLASALHDFSSRQPDGSFPGPEPAGPRAAAGISGPVLVSLQFLSDPRNVLCPSSPAARDVGAFRVPTLEEVDRARGEALAELHRLMGGDYGYNMGYLLDGRLMKPCNSRRANYVLLSDAPSDTLPGRASANHRGRGQNLLYEDGHVKFHRELLALPAGHDDPFHNRAGRVEAGLDCEDAVLGASPDHPLPLRLIRE